MPNQNIPTYLFQTRNAANALNLITCCYKIATFWRSDFTEAVANSNCFAKMKHITISNEEKVSLYIK